MRISTLKLPRPSHSSLSQKERLMERFAEPYEATPGDLLSSQPVSYLPVIGFLP